MSTGYLSSFASTLSMTQSAPSSMHAAARLALVSEDRGRHTYFAISPGYASSRLHYVIVKSVRIVVCVLYAAAFICAIVGASTCYRTEDGYLGPPFPPYQTVVSVYSWSVDPTSNQENSNDYFETDATVVLGVFSCVFSFMAFVMEAVHAAEWTKIEKQRAADARDNAQLVQAYQIKCDVDTKGEAVADSYECNELCVKNVGQVHETPLEARERVRRSRDNDLGTATFVIMVLSAAFTLATLLYMSQNGVVPVCNASICNEHKSTVTTFREGYWCMLAALITGCVGFLLLSVPGISEVYLCYRPPVARCRLMAVDVNRGSHPPRLPLSVE